MPPVVDINGEKRRTKVADATFAGGWPGLARLSSHRDGAGCGGCAIAVPRSRPGRSRSRIGVGVQVGRSQRPPPR